MANPMTRISTRRAVPDDAAVALAVLRASITELCVADHENDPRTLEPWLRNKTPAEFAGWLSDADNYMVVAELDSMIRGVGALHKSGEIRLCYVQPGMQGMGVGAALLGALEAQASAWRIPKLVLRSTTRARSFYEHKGYVTSGEAACGFGDTLCFPYEKVIALRTV